MGLFTKEPAEKKAYQKAFSAALSKQNEATFSALDQACGAWPAGWQGCLLMGLCYDLSVGKIPFDPEKAAHYHKLCRERAKTQKNDWVDTFYAYYEDYAGNFRIKEEYFPRAMNIRKAITAMMTGYSPDENHIITDALFKGDLKFWEAIFSGVDTGGLFKATDEQMQCLSQVSPVRSVIYAWKNHNAEDQTRISITNDMIKAWNKFKKKSPDEVTLTDEDIRGFIFGYSLLTGGGAYDNLNGASNWHTNLRIDGWMALWHAAHRGCVPALHFIATLFDDKDLCGEIYYAYSQVYSSGANSRTAVSHQLLTMLEEAAVKGDPQAIDYIEAIAD